MASPGSASGSTPSPNSRTAFSALRGNSLATLSIPLRSGMSVGLVLVAIELFFMIAILTFLPASLAGACFVGFAIGESLGASALRICGASSPRSPTSAPTHEDRLPAPRGRPA